MTQISRPFQLALLLVGVLAAAYFTVLRSHSPAGSGASGSSSPPAASTSHAASSSEGQPTHIYKGPVPGLKGLTRAISRAHEAVGTSEANAHKLEGDTASVGTGTGASSSTQGASAASAAARSAAPKATGTGAGTTSRHGASMHKSASNTHRGQAASRKSSKTSSSRGHSHGAGGVSRTSHAHESQADVVARQLHEGRTVLLLFWNSRSFDDQAVHSEVQSVVRSMGHRVAADYATPSEVGAFGTVTRNVNVLGTPTLMIIDRQDKATTITGLTDAFAIEQAVREARG